MENKVTLTAHRGWRAKYPENTMRGFREALRLDISYLHPDDLYGYGYLNAIKEVFLDGNN